MRRSLVAKGFVAAIGLLHGPSIAAAQDAPGKALSIELNKSTDSEKGCRLTFVAQNGTGVDLTKTSYEIAVFDANNQVAKLLVLAFNGLSQNKTKVFEFQYPDAPCNGISRILVNTAPECLAGGAASPVCLEALKTATRTNIAFNQ